MTDWIPTPNLEQFELNPSRAINRWLTWKLNIIDTANIFIHRENHAKVTLTEMGEALGLIDSEVKEKLIYHQNRLRVYETIQSVLIIMVSFVASIILSVIAIFYVLLPGAERVISLYNYLDSQFRLNGFLNVALSILLFALLFYLLYLIVGIPIALALKGIALITDKPYAESINAWTLICLLLELTDNDSLQNQGSRQALVKRLHDLSLGISLLPRQYHLKDPGVETWSRQHFNEMRQYILDRQCWVLAPVETTLTDLRRDFRWLFDIYINNMYGHISWPEKKPQESDDQPPATSEKSVSFLPRLLGYLIPIGILAYLIINPDVIAFLNLKVDTLGLITLGWVLLGIDTLLGLGVTASITDFLKGIKELSS